MCSSRVGSPKNLSVIPNIELMVFLMEVSRSDILARKLSVLTSVAAMSLSVLVLLGWATGNPYLRGEVFGSPPSQPVTAAVFILIAASIIALSRGYRTPAILTGTFILTLYILTITAYLTGGVLPEYGSRFITSVLFIIYSLVLIMFALSRYTLPQVITFPAGIISYCVIAGYMAGLGVYGEYFLMALYTAIIHLLICTSLLSLYPERGVLAPINASFTGGYVVRLLLPVMVTGITILGITTLRIRSFLFPGFGEVFLMGMMVSLTIIALVMTADELRTLDRKGEAYRRELADSRRFFSEVVENLAEAVAVLDGDGEVVYRNAAMKELGITEFPDHEGDAPVPIERMKVHERYYTGWMVPGPGGGAIVSLTDITDLIEAKRSLEDALGERDALLSEVHHRVKNNLQIIVSLLNIQAIGADEETRRVLMDAQARVRAMAIIHETIYDSGDFSGVLMSSFITRLIERLITVFSAHGVRFNVDADVRLNLETAIPLGLFINEAVTNSIRHAFPGGEGTVEVTITSNDILHLTVADDGRGIGEAPEGTVGLSLMGALADQLDGEMEISSDHGTVVSLRFRELEYTRRF